MIQHDCELVRHCAMARAEGEDAPLSDKEIQSHLQACCVCRQETSALAATMGSWSRVRRRIPPADLWPPIRAQLATAPSPAAKLGSATILFLALFAVLLASRTTILLAEPSLAWMARAAAFALVCLLFVVLRQNPFAIDPHLPHPKGHQL